MAIKALLDMQMPFYTDTDHERNCNADWNILYVHMLAISSMATVRN